MNRLIVIIIVLTVLIIGILYLKNRKLNKTKEKLQKELDVLQEKKNNILKERDKDE